MEMAHHVRRRYPDLQIAGEPMMPPTDKLYMAYALKAVFFAGLVVQIAGGMILPAEIHEKYVSNNRMAIFIAMMGANMVSGSIMTTNAFEISHDGVQVWSAMERGRLPHVEELFQELGRRIR